MCQGMAQIASQSMAPGGLPANRRPRFAALRALVVSGRLLSYFTFSSNFISNGKPCSRNMIDPDNVCVIGQGRLSRPMMCQRCKSRPLRIFSPHLCHKCGEKSLVTMSSDAIEING